MYVCISTKMIYLHVCVCVCVCVCVFVFGQIQLRAYTKNKSPTEWTKHFAVNAVGTSGNFSAKLGENNYSVRKKPLINVYACVCVCVHMFTLYDHYSYFCGMSISIVVVAILFTTQYNIV